MDSIPIVILEVIADSIPFEYMGTAPYANFGTTLGSKLVGIGSGYGCIEGVGVTKGAELVGPVIRFGGAGTVTGISCGGGGAIAIGAGIFVGVGCAITSIEGLK